MKQYLELCEKVLTEGHQKNDRTGTGTISYFGAQMRFDLNDGFPLLTTKKVHLKSIIYELLWFIKGDTNIKYLVDHDVRMWNEWPYEKYKNSCEYLGETIEEFIDKIKNDELFAKKYGDLGPVYGKQWRHFGIDKYSIDQLKNVILDIKNNPDSRRLIVCAWNPLEIDQMALPPCHSLFQFYVNEGKLSCMLYQRSADLFLGVPFNIASYALLTMMVAKVCNLELGSFIHTLGDVHIYNNHLEQIKKQLARKPRELPKMKINRETENIEDFVYEDFELIDYNPHKGIKGKVAV